MSAGDELERWVLLLGAARVVAEGGVPEAIGGGGTSIQDQALAAAWAQRAGYAAEELDGVVAAHLRGADQPSAFAWHCGEAVFLAGLRHRMTRTSFAPTRFFRVAVQMAHRARARFTSWAGYFDAYLTGAEQVGRVETARLQRCVAALLDGACAEVPWTLGPAERPDVRSLAFQIYSLCVGCGQYSRADRAEGRTRCRRCRHPIELPETKRLLRAAARDALDKLPSMRGGLMFAGAGNLCRVEPRPVTCRRCQRAVPVTVLLDQPETPSLQCAFCQLQLTVRRLDDATREDLEGIEWLIGEDVLETGEAKNRLVVTCAHCGSRLRAGLPDAREWDCADCGGVTELPACVIAALEPEGALVSTFAVARPG